MRAIATAGAVTWDRTPPTGVQWYFHKQSLYDELIRGSNLIFSATQRAAANWLVAGVGVCDVLETLEKYDSVAAGPPANAAGVYKAGRIGNFDVYKDPTYPTDEFLMGHKGTNFLDTGYVYAPYLALYTTPTITLDDMISRKGMCQRTGRKVVNANMYATGSIAQSGSRY